MAKDVVIIQQTTQTQQERKRVAAYARVSCGKDTMLHSLAAQIDYYRKLILNNPTWKFAGVFADEAKTGTKEDRAEFQALIAECRVGAIDIVITKSISRFARNTVTLLKYVVNSSATTSSLSMIVKHALSQTLSASILCPVLAQ